MAFRSEIHQKAFFIAISSLATRHHCAPDDSAHGQEIFKTLFHFLTIQDSGAVQTDPLGVGAWTGWGNNSPYPP
jgi:hypothetical protein